MRNPVALSDLYNRLIMNRLRVALSDLYYNRLIMNRLREF